MSRHHAIAFAVCAGVSGVAILYTQVRAMMRCATHARWADGCWAGQPHDCRTRGCQHCAVRRRVHAAEANKRRQHLGGRGGGRHPAAHGLGRRSRPAGAGRGGARRLAVLLADAALHGACVPVPHRLRRRGVRSCNARRAA
jgi:hypothetical protein